jgi:hypothetical protein
VIFHCRRFPRITPSIEQYLVYTNLYYKSPITRTPTKPVNPYLRFQCSRAKERKHYVNARPIM